jgi:hypothetical protein
MTSFSPDQTSLTAHTLMSTRPMGRHTVRIVSSVMSVGTFDAFFGHDTQTNPSCSSAPRSVARCLSISVLRATNT